VYVVRYLKQGRNEVRWRPGQETSLAPPISNLSSFRTKYTVLKTVLAKLLGHFATPRSDSAPGESYPPCPLVTSLLQIT